MASLRGILSVRYFAYVRCLRFELWLGMLLWLTLSACSTVRVQQASNASAHIAVQQQSILTGSQLSYETQQLLIRAGFNQKECIKQIERCLNQLTDVLPANDDDYMAAASELHLAYTQTLAQSTMCRVVLQNTANMQAWITRIQAMPEIDVKVSECKDLFYKHLLQSIRYSYAYLFFPERTWQYRSFKGRPVQVRDFYNIAVAYLLETQFAVYKTQKNNPTKTLQAANTNLSIQFYSDFLAKLPIPEEFVASSFLNINGLNSVFKRDGIGAGFVAVLPENQTTQEKHIVQSQFLPVSIFVRIEGKNITEVLNSTHLTIEVYNPFETKEVRLTANASAPLAADYSAPYALWLARTPLDRLAYTTLLSRSHFTPELYMLEPYNPKKRVVIFVHGLASSPVTWLQITNDIQGDARLRENYQMWQVFYPTNMPILENRYQLKQVITNAFAMVDPKGKDPASQHAVLIGHSMGGIITKLLIADEDLSSIAWAELSRGERTQLQRIPEVKARYQLTSLPQVSRAVFIAAPLKGTDYADLWFTRALRKIIGLPVNTIKAITRPVITGVSPQLLQRLQQQGVLNFENGPSELSKQSRFMHITQHVQWPANVPVHTIIGRKDKNKPLVESSDGIVPYLSAHIEGATSEKVVNAEHNVHTTPEAIAEMRRILRLHLDTLP